MTIIFAYLGNYKKKEEKRPTVFCDHFAKNVNWYCVEYWNVFIHSDRVKYLEFYTETWWKQP